MEMPTPDTQLQAVPKRPKEAPKEQEPKPPPRQFPCTTASIGISSRLRSSNASAKTPIFGRRIGDGTPGQSRTSPPRQKSGPAPFTIRARVWLAATRRMASRSSSRIARWIRLPGGWSRVTLATAPSRSTRTLVTTPLLGRQCFKPASPAPGNRASVTRSLHNGLQARSDRCRSGGTRSPACPRVASCWRPGKAGR
jgi:hypothetical protein